MDPNVCLKRIADAIQDGEYEDADDFCDELYEWIDKQGFQPEWDSYPEAAAYYREYTTEAYLPEYRPSIYPADKNLKN